MPLGPRKTGTSLNNRWSVWVPELVNLSNFDFALQMLVHVIASGDATEAQGPLKTNSDRWDYKPWWNLATGISQIKSWVVWVPAALPLRNWDLDQHSLVDVCASLIPLRIKDLDQHTLVCVSDSCDITEELVTRSTHAGRWLCQLRCHWATETSQT